MRGSARRVFPRAGHSDIAVITIADAVSGNMIEEELSKRCEIHIGHLLVLGANVEAVAPR